MYELILFCLFPLIELNNLLFNLFYSITGFSDIAVILLSITISMLLMPLLKFAKITEEKFSLKLSFVNEDINKLPAGLKGEHRFKEIEKIYNKFSYHPIENIKSGMTFIYLLPFFLSIFLFFQENVDGFYNTGLFIKDLSKSDGFLSGINIVPILIFIINVIDSRFRYQDTNNIKNIYLLTSLMICILIYNLPLCMTLYWATSSIISLTGSLYR